MNEEKENNWCSMCHVNDECEEKDSFLESDEDACPYYAQEEKIYVGRRND